MLKGEVAEKSDKQVLGVVTVSHMSQHFYQGAPILYQNMRESLLLSYTQIGIITGVINILGGFLQIFFSLAGRRFSRRLLLAGSNILMGLGCAVTGAANGFNDVIVGSAASGTGQAGQHPVSSSIITQKYEKKGMGMALSVFFGLGYIGNIISPLLLSSVALVSGWRTSFFVLALIPLATGLLIVFTLRGEPSADRVITKQMTDRHLLQDIRSSLRVKGAISILVSYSVISGGTGMGVMTTWVPVFLRDPSKGLGLDIFYAGLISSVATVGGVLGTIYLGKIADRMGYLKIAIVSLAATTTMITLLNFYTSFNIFLIPNLFILSMTTFSLTSLMQAHLTSICTRAERDILIGLFFTVGSGVSSLWSTVLGALIDKYSFNAVWIVMASAGIMGLLLQYNAYRAIKPKHG